jgi:lysophospholipase L1-like esterase
VIGPPVSHVEVVAALGDSVPAGSACDCTPYPELTAGDIENRTEHGVTAYNDAVPGYQSSDVLAQLQSDSGTIGHVEQADVVEVEIGANDIAYSSACGTQTSCYEDELPTVKHNIEAIVDRVRSVTAGRSVAVVLLGYWSVWLGGQYAQAQGPAYVDAADSLTLQLNSDIKAIAASDHAAYVDLRTAFKGPNDDGDETYLLASDGDHPNAAGHERIALATEQTLATALAP